MNFYDTAGQEKFKSLIPMYIRDANIIIIVFDIGKRVSFDHVKTWIKEISDLKKDNAIISIVGNKIDLPDKEINGQDIEELMKETGLWMSTLSAKSGDGVEYYFDQLFMEIAKTFNLSGDYNDNDSSNVTEKFDLEKIKKVPDKKKKCCKS